jgi:hypothetical protein
MSVLVGVLALGWQGALREGRKGRGEGGGGKEGVLETCIFGEKQPPNIRDLFIFLATLRHLRRPCYENSFSS